MDEKKVTTLTPVERLQLTNQFLILEKLDPTNAEQYAKNRTILEDGYTLLYSELFQGIGDEMSVADCRYVYDVLDMYRALRHSYEELTDKEGLTLNDVRFHGFDGNNETNYYVFIRFLQEEGRRWTETLKDCGLNTHSETNERYAVMLHAASRAAKRWPDERWIELGRMLAAQGLATVFPGGSAAERAGAARLAAEVPLGLAAPAMPLAEAAALLAHADGVVGVDTGLTHLAVALDVPTVGIYCATRPELTGLHGGAHALNVGGAGNAPGVEAVAAAIGFGAREE